MYDVWALVRDGNLLYDSGNYRTVSKVRAGSLKPASEVEGYSWKRIGLRLTETEADAVIAQYRTNEC
jgi:hypothetical protein